MNIWKLNTKTAIEIFYNMKILIVEDISQNEQIQIINLLIEFINNYDPINGELFWQSDTCHLESPVLVCQMIDVLKEKIKNNDEE